MMPEIASPEVVPQRSSRHFVATCYEVFLGRELDAVEVAIERGEWSTGRVLRSFLTCDEFTGGVAFPLRWEEPFLSHLYQDKFTIRHRLWAADQLPLSDTALDAMWRARSWRSFLVALISDERLMMEAGLSAIQGLPEYGEEWVGEALEPSIPTKQVTIMGASSDFVDR